MRMSFSDHVLAVDDAVEGHLCDPAVYRSLDAPDVDVPIMAILERPTQEETIQQSSWARAQPMLHIRARAVARPRQGDLVQFGAGPWDAARETWALAETPSAPDDGAWWIVVVECA